VRLEHWSRALQYVEFDATAGVGRGHWLSSPRPSDAGLAGFASSERGWLGRRHWFALFRTGDEIVFQAGKRRWRVGDPEVSYVHVQPTPFSSRFEVRKGGHPELSFRYHNLGRALFARVDPGYDGIDHETDYFLEFVAINAGSASWRQNALEQWQSAT